MKTIEIVGDLKKFDVKNNTANSVIKLTGEFEKIYDGFHEVNEIYGHRIMLFIALMKSHKELSWRTRKHNDGNSITEWFIGGMNLPSGQITYHIPNSFWGVLDDINTLEVAPAFDGHTSDMVITRLNNWCFTL